MPLVNCPACRHQQIVPRELAGLSVSCERCGKSYVADERAEARKPSPRMAPAPAGPDPLQPAALLKGAGLVLGLVAAVAVVVGGAILIIRAATAPAKTEPTRLTAPTAPAEAPVRRDGNDRLAPPERSPDPGMVAAGGVAVVVAVAVFALVVCYFAAVFLAGGWVARDAYARGMAGLPWATFYYVYQIVARVVIYPVAMIPAALTSLLIPGLGLLVLAGAELIAWCGLFAYLIARRQGRLVRCRNCDNARLDSLPDCPHCRSER